MWGPRLSDLAKVIQLVGSQDLSSRQSDTWAFEFNHYDLPILNYSKILNKHFNLLISYFHLFCFVTQNWIQ